LKLLKYILCLIFKKHYAIEKPEINEKLFEIELTMLWF